MISESGEDHDIIQIIEEPDKIIQIAFEDDTPGEKRCLIMFSTVNAFLQETDIDWRTRVD